MSDVGAPWERERLRRPARAAALLVLAVVTAACSQPVAPGTSATTLPATTTTGPPSTTTSGATTTAATTTTVSARCAASISDAVQDRIRRTVDSGLSMGIVAGIVGPCGSDVFAYGKASAAGGRPLDEDTVFEIGSTGKVFTGLLLADLAQRNEVALSDPIERYLPAEVPAPTYRGRSITLIDLATHTSGLPPLPGNLAPADELNPYADYTVAQLYEALATTELTREIGSMYEYSNFGMGVLGHLLELQSGLGYEELVVERITDELGMPDTRVTLTPDMADRLAVGYRDGEPFPLWDNPTLAGAGALRSTGRDMLTFLAANLGLQGSRLYDAMQLTHRRLHSVDPAMGVGLGWHIRTHGQDEVVEQHGATGGYWCFAGLIEETRVGVVVLSNTFHDVDEIGLALLRQS